VQFAAISS